MSILLIGILWYSGSRLVRCPPDPPGELLGFGLLGLLAVLAGGAVGVFSNSFCSILACRTYLQDFPRSTMLFRTFSVSNLHTHTHTWGNMHVNEWTV